MDHIDYEEEHQSAAFEYVMPLSGANPSPAMGRSTSTDGEDSVEFDYNEDQYRTVTQRGTGRGGSSNRRSSQETEDTTPWSNRRSSHETEATTPRFQNVSSGGRWASMSEEAPMGGGLPTIPFADRSERSLGKSQNGLGDFLAKNNNSSSVKFSMDQDGNNSLPSLPLHAVFGPSTPTSNAASSYSRRTPDPTRRSAQQIGMDGVIKELPLSPNTTDDDEEEESTMHSTAVSPSRHHSPKKLRSESHRESSLSRETQLMHASMYSVTSHATEHYPTDRTRDHDGESTDDEDNMFMPIICCGCFVLPMWLSTPIRASPSLERISRCVVNVLPCFWCLPKATQGRSTDRTVLIRLTVLCLIMTFVQVAMSMWLVAVLLIMDDQAGALRGFAPHFWNCNGAAFSIGILAFILIITCSCTIRVMQEVDLVGAIRYLWVIFWIVPFEIFFNISLYDYHNVTKIWIRHWWLADHMSWFRFYFCGEENALTKCLVPILGGADYDTEEGWCLANYNATDCAIIRDDAQEQMEGVMLTYYTGLAGWTSLLLVLMLLMVNTFERIITKPIVQKSRETNVPAWLSLPTITNAMVGTVLLFSSSSLLSSSSGAENSWIGIVYLVVAGLFLVALLTGWFLSAYTIQNHGDKQTKNIAVILMIIMMAANVVMLATIFVASILFSANLINVPIDESQRGIVACNVDRGETCTRCDDLIPSLRCPEWTLQEVTTILQTQLKQSATLASIFILYAVSVLRFGVTLRKHLSLYQIDYV